AAGVDEAGRAGNGWMVAEDRVAEVCFELAGGVAKLDLDRGCLVVGLDVARRKARDRGLAGGDRVADVAEVESGRAVGMFDDDGGDPVIAAATRRILEGDRVAETVAEAGERPDEMGVAPAAGQRGA